jgi:hypothetical protein
MGERILFVAATKIQRAYSRSRRRHMMGILCRALSSHCAEWRRKRVDTTTRLQAWWRGCACRRVLKHQLFCHSALWRTIDIILGDYATEVGVNFYASRIQAHFRAYMLALARQRASDQQNKRRRARRVQQQTQQQSPPPGRSGTFITQQQPHARHNGILEESKHSAPLHQRQSQERSSRRPSQEKPPPRRPSQDKPSHMSPTVKGRTVVLQVGRDSSTTTSSTTTSGAIPHDEESMQHQHEVAEEDAASSGSAAS